MMKEAIAAVVEGKDLSRKEAKEVFDEIMQGKATDAQIAALLVGLRMKGETSDEIAGAAESMRKVVAKVEPKVKERLLDVVGTGGDKKGTINVSTAAAIVAAGAGCVVAKHGNRSVSSRSGAADVFQQLGVKIELTNVQNSRVIENIGIAFLFAPIHHPAMKYAIGPRREIGVRTIFNILGPITNPANAQTYLLGVYDRKVAEKIADSFVALGVEKALVVSGDDGCDEISLCGPTTVFEVENGKVKNYKIKPEDFGFKKCKEQDVCVDGAMESAADIRKIFEGELKGAKRNIIALNAGAAIYANKKAKSIKEGIEMAKESIDSGKALEKLEMLVKESNKF
jgi:anthranilate phosphoribosyltransferase